MGRAPCCSKVGLHRGPWSAREDALLSKYIQANGEGNWRSMPKKAGLLRCGKSCRLRWMNYLRPDIKRGNIGPDEEDLIIRLHNLLGNRWSLIAGRLPGRTDNEIKNYWNTHISKKLKSQRSNNCVTKWRSTKNWKQKTGVTESPTKTMVLLPKPTRLASFKITPQFSTIESSDDGSIDKNKEPVFGVKGEANEGVINPLPWHDHEEEHSQLLNEDFFTQSEIPMKNSMLDKLIEEYLDLIKAQERQVQEDSLEEFSWA